MHVGARVSGVSDRGGPLAGLKVIEFAGLGPGPFCAMMMADLGALVLRIERPGGASPFGADPVLGRGRATLTLDLKGEADRARCLDLVAGADALIEGFRPGVMERLGLGPEACHARNPRLVYGRVTGWGQEGPLAPAVGHDVNYLALSGMLWPLGPADRPPPPPLNLVADFGGGGMLLAVGLLAALHAARATGRGQVVDAAMVDGAALLGGMIHGWLGSGGWREEREANLLDGGAPFYGVYETSDGKWVSIGALEPPFYAALIRELGLDAERFGGAAQMDRSRWPALRAAIAEAFRQRSREEWCRRLEGSDLCFAPVLAPSEAPDHPHNQARATFVTHDGLRQPAPAPRFDGTPAALAGTPTLEETLRAWGGGRG